MNDYPPELRYKPIPLVAVSGASREFLTALEKATSATVVEAQRSCPIFTYTSITSKEFSVPPRNDKEKTADYQPEGIIPTGWLNAFLHRIPCAIIHVVEWDAPDAKSREFEHYATIDALRCVMFIGHLLFFEDYNGLAKCRPLYFTLFSITWLLIEAI